MYWNVSFGQTLYMKNLKDMLSLYTSGDDFLSLSIKDLCAFHKNDTLSRIQLLPSLRRGSCPSENLVEEKQASF